ncbi:hypothetical protein KKP04_07185 [Rhodomicrobium sp. Az07]|uniref:hypothetical protein n=1 Tax=Rhodomicrobium sp. Az07 TaxID=2839034 RepID=UPI001BE5A3EC|nr:hypothetical protein [Rhodomicrobium sp. Az07]MBT3070647.1 hypothetical protein [Rhodomicrobium sp. Az07]
MSDHNNENKTYSAQGPNTAQAPQGWYPGYPAAGYGAPYGHQGWGPAAQPQPQPQEQGGQPQAPGWYGPAPVYGPHPWFGHHHHPHFQPYGYGYGPQPSPQAEAQAQQKANSGFFSSGFDIHNDALVKGVVIGAGLTYLLTNETVQKNLIGAAVKLWSTLQGGVEEVKERFRDAEAEIHTDGHQQ